MDVYMVKKETLTDIADAIREKRGNDEGVAINDVAPFIESSRPAYGEIISDISSVTLGANGSMVDGKVVSTATDTKTFLSFNIRTDWDGDNIYYIQKITPEMCPAIFETDISYQSETTLHAKHNGTKTDIRLFSIVAPARPVKLCVEIEKANPSVSSGIVISKFEIREK